jgi:hypothetical protein
MEIFSKTSLCHTSSSTKQRSKSSAESAQSTAPASTSPTQFPRLQYPTKPAKWIFFRKRSYPIPPPPPPPRLLDLRPNQRSQRDLHPRHPNNARGTNTPWYRYSVQHDSPDWTKYLEMVRLITSPQ